MGVSVIEPGELRLTHYPSNLVSTASAKLGALVTKRVEFKECPDMAVCSGVRLVSSGITTKRAPQGLGSADMQVRSPERVTSSCPLTVRLAAMRQQ